MRKSMTVVLAMLVLLSATTPAYADCCDSVFSCAAAVVTDGLSCVIEELIATVKSLITLVTNALDMANGATQSAAKDAQQKVDDTIYDFRMQSDLSGRALAAAEQQATAIYQSETEARELTANSVASNGAKPITAQSPTPNAVAKPASAAPANRATGPVQARTATRSAGTAPVATPTTSPPPESSHQATAVLTPQAVATVESTLPPPGSFASLFGRAVDEVKALKTLGTQDAQKVEEFMMAAKESEGPGVQSASRIADQAINAPLQNLKSQLTAMLANPTTIFDPSSTVDAITNSVLGNLDVSIAQMVDSISAGPQRSFDAAAQQFEELTVIAERAGHIAAAMDTLHRLRTKGAEDKLVALLPKVLPAEAAGNAKMLRASAGDHPTYQRIMTKFIASKKSVSLAQKQRVQQLSAALDQLKSVRQRAMAARSAAPTYKTNLSQKLNAYFTGKTAAEIATQREQLVAQARSRFANDPKMRDAVAALLTAEGNKHEPRK